MVEGQNIEYKSLKKAIGKQADLKSLAETCVCFANAQGGRLVIGLEDGESEPPPTQKVKESEINEVVKRLKSLTDGVSLTHSGVQTNENSGQYFTIVVYPSIRTIATTTSGKVLLRIGDSCFAVGNEDLTSLAAEKTAFQWEIIAPQKISWENVAEKVLAAFLNAIKTSDKVSDFVKEKEPFEILEFYQLVEESGILTNLGILWLGTPQQRARLSYPVTVQYIVYNDKEEKVRKKEWHYHLHNPQELLEDIEREAVELTYSTEISEGLYRKTIRNYPREVVRELLVNAIAHKKYTISGDIFVEVYPDRLVISNPGSLPLGVTQNNILRERRRRNPHLITILSDLKLMEGEGSGYDLIYEKLAMDAKPLPKIDSDFSRVSVTVYSGLLNPEAVSILDYVAKNFLLSQKEYIALGIIATEKKILSTQLASKLQLQEEDKIARWVGGLLEKHIIVSRGIKKGTEYLLNPELFAQARLGITPSLKTLEPYRIKALVLEYLKYNGKAGVSEIANKLPEIPLADLRKTIYGMVDAGELDVDGAKRNRIYLLPKKNK